MVHRSKCVCVCLHKSVDLDVEVSVHVCGCIMCKCLGECMCVFGRSSSICARSLPGFTFGQKPGTYDIFPAPSTWLYTTANLWNKSTEVNDFGNSRERAMQASRSLSSFRQSKRSNEDSALKWQKLLLPAALRRLVSQSWLMVKTLQKGAWAHKSQL